MLQDQSIPNLVSKAIVSNPNNTYVASFTSFSDGAICDGSYFFGKFPPIVIEVQQIVNENFMSRAICYCLNVYQQFKEYLVLVIYCVKNVASKSLASKFISHPQFPY
ncbi:hypothetical protein BDB00DRAFT_867699 [Zychaea mexicana]|uniref:uncharacterized protein n=1 Tax=Zychaea mexicana TaxID=64656 RepID=UPI0022FDB489|nr:uncharacterized protein BDB00DRAFT_867699 [Zychaea mexicana]KAI9498044.1 hypothetical protein BDB00DRAFT_867699 [Zychaea mexicana]